VLLISKERWDSIHPPFFMGTCKITASLIVTTGNGGTVRRCFSRLVVARGSQWCCSDLALSGAACLVGSSFIPLDHKRLSRIAMGDPRMTVDTPICKGARRRTGGKNIMACVQIGAGSCIEAGYRGSRTGRSGNVGAGIVAVEANISRRLCL